MTYFYNATGFSRKEHYAQSIIDFLVKTYPEMHIENSVIKRPISIVSSILEKYFEFYMKEHFSDAQSIFDISDILSEANLPVVMTNKFFKFTFYPRASTDISVPTPQMFNKKLNISERGPQLTLKSKEDRLDRKAFDQSWIPNAIQFHDATIVHFFIFKHIIINNKLQDLKEHARLYYFTNHDSFSMQFAEFGDILLEDCYQDYLKSDPLASITDNCSQEVKDKIMDCVDREMLVIPEISKYYMK